MRYAVYACGLAMVVAMGLILPKPCAAAAAPTTAVNASSRDARVLGGDKSWTFETAKVQKTVALIEGRLVAVGFQNKPSGRDMIAKGQFADELSAELLGVNIKGPWRPERAEAITGKQGELHFKLTLLCEPVAATKHYVIYPGSSVIRQWTTIENRGAEPLKVVEPRMLRVMAYLGNSPETLDFHWMVGAHNERGSWTLRTEELTPGKPRAFDSYDPFPPRGKPSPNDQKMGSESYAPWYALYDRRTRDGLIIGWDYMGHWASQFRAAKDGLMDVELRVAGHRQTLAPGESLTTPMAFTALYRDDLDNAGNELLDWQYEYLWDYTRDGWFPTIPMLGFWHKGTGWGEPNVPWWGSGRTDIASQFTKIFRMADVIRHVGADNYHRDWGWWDRAGDWNGPDFGTSGRYLRKSDIGQIIYAFLYTVDPQSELAKAHPDWLIGQTLDMSKPEVCEHMQRQLDDFHQRWGDFAWRNDSTPTAPRAGDDTPLLAQDQNFRRIIQTFLDKYPRSSFQSVNGGGNEAGYDYVRLSGMFQFTDGGAIMPLRNYYTSLLFPPDKLMDNGDQWRPDEFDKAKWRPLLSMALMTTGDTRNKAKLEGLRELFDLYHYLAAQGVVGRWVKVYRPLVEGDDATMYLQRLSRDRRRGLIVPARPAAGKLTIRPKGLLPEENYRITLHETPGDETRTGADLMERGITLASIAPGELIYLNLPLHPGSGRDHTPPGSPSEVAQQPGENMGYPGVELRWKAAADDHWLSYYEVLRDDVVIDKVAKGLFYFDHSAGADMVARYEVRAVDGSGNRSATAAAAGARGQRACVVDDADAAVTFTGKWQHERDAQPAHRETIAWSNEKGAAVEVPCEGQRVRWFSKLGANCGKAKVTIDNGPPEIVDTYCSDDVWGVCVYQKDLPSGGRHTLRIEVVGARNERSTGTCVHLDGVRAEAAAVELSIDCSRSVGQIRPLHGINTGPLHAHEIIDLSDRHREIGVPLTRLHDCHWPNPDVVDIHTLFPDAKADPSRPESYDFRRTDDYIGSIVKVGSGIVFRLGESIEHTRRKYHVHPPADAEKWAAVCAGVVRHYNEGWAGGFRHNIRYWEIWNEPENRPAMWTGNDEQFLDLYVAAAKAIKRQSPGVLVGGPAFGYVGKLQGESIEPTPFAAAFLARCKRDNAPLDFFSWHCYTNDPGELVRRARAVRRLLDAAGFAKTESHLNEWSYLPDADWGPMMTKDALKRRVWFERQGGAEGAAFTAAALLRLQDAPLDATNYYSADIQGFGMFDEHGVPKKVFYALKAFKLLADTPARLAVQGTLPDALAAVAGMDQAKQRVMIVASNHGKEARALRFSARNLPWAGKSTVEVLVLDATRDLAPVETRLLDANDAAIEQALAPASVVVLRISPTPP